MGKITFKFDKEKDLLNCWNLSNQENSFNKNFHIDSRIKKICEGKKFEECKKELSDYLSKIYNSPMIKLSIEV